MRFQVCSNCAAEIDCVYASCPNCGSLSLHESSSDDEIWEKLDPMESYVIDYPCEEYGHIWSDGRGGFTRECVRCGHIE